MRTTLPMAMGRIAAAAALAAALAGPGDAALHSVFLTVPLHSEEALTWCGPATAQMTIEGYPSAGCAKTQDEVWLAIQASKAEGMWDSDPAGMRGAMMSLCPPSAGGHWVVFSPADPTALMYSVAFWMTHNNYPAVVLLDTVAHNSYAPHQEHWVVVKGIVTDVDPTTHPTVNLQYVWFNDPAVPLGDPPLERYVAAGTWYGELQAVTKMGSAYQTKYVAVIEPPERPGRAIAPREVLVGRVIPPREALRHAAKWISSLGLSRIGPFKGLEGGTPLEPMLVNAARGGYYLIPYSSGEGGTRLAVAVNAYTGGFQEAGSFAPARFLPQQAAVEAALRFLGVKEPRKVTAALESSPAVGSPNRYLPSWRIDVDGSVVVVTNAGEVRRPPRKGEPK
jgi:hypothetical protein